MMRARVEETINRLLVFHDVGVPTAHFKSLFCHDIRVLEEKNTTLLVVERHDLNRIKNKRFRNKKPLEQTSMYGRTGSIVRRHNCIVERSLGTNFLESTFETCLGIYRIGVGTRVLWKRAGVRK